MSKCVCDPSTLVAVIDDDRTNVNYDAVVDHLSGCETCQHELEQIAAGDWWWSEGRPWIASCEGIHSASGKSSVIAICASDQPHVVGWSGHGSIDFLDPPAQPELLGQLGKYQIESLIGQGGMGIVLKGFDTELHRSVAIKVLAPHLASSGSARQRFAREARAAAAVVHDHVVAIYGIESTEELPYLVMPYIGGESLQKYVDSHGPLDAVDITRIAMQIAAGLSAAHEQGLVHRDVKPANILLENGFGRVLITDFGLARAADDASITRSGLLAGTPHYMSPEQARGEAVDQRSDLFSLGSVMYFMATGRAPFRGDGALAVLNAICQKNPPRIQDVNAAMPQPMELVVHRLLRREPRSRFESAAAVRTLLADYLAHLQNPTRNRLPPELSTPGLRTGWLAAAAMAIFIAGLVGVFSFWPQIGVTRSEQETAAASPAQTTSAPAGATDEPLRFDVEARDLATALARLEERWRSVSTPESSTQNWDEPYEQLKADFKQVEREWSKYPEE